MLKLGLYSMTPNDRDINESINGHYNKLRKKNCTKELG